MMRLACIFLSFSSKFSLTREIKWAYSPRFIVLSLRVYAVAGSLVSFGLLRKKEAEGKVEGTKRIMLERIGQLL